MIDDRHRIPRGFGITRDHTVGEILLNPAQRSLDATGSRFDFNPPLLDRAVRSPGLEDGLRRDFPGHRNRNLEWPAPDMDLAVASLPELGERLIGKGIDEPIHQKGKSRTAHHLDRAEQNDGEQDRDDRRQERATEHDPAHLVLDRDPIRLIADSPEHLRRVAPPALKLDHRGEPLLERGIDAIQPVRRVAYARAERQAFPDHVAQNQEPGAGGNAHDEAECGGPERSHPIEQHHHAREDQAECQQRQQQVGNPEDETPATG